jgi:hypothetical protein
MTEIVECVALVLTRAKVGFDDATVPVDAARVVARAVIAAMREPTGAMVEAGWPHTADPCWEHNVADTWRAMIDAALRD